MNWTIKQAQRLIDESLVDSPLWREGYAVLIVEQKWLNREKTETNLDGLVKSRNISNPKRL